MSSARKRRKLIKYWVWNILTSSFYS